MSDDELDLLQEYRELHNHLSDMIEDGRLTATQVPEDYQRIVEALASAAALDCKIQEDLEAGY